MKNKLQSLIANINDNKEDLLNKFSVGKIVIKNNEEKYNSILGSNNVVMLGTKGSYIIVECIEELKNDGFVLFYSEDIESFTENTQYSELNEIYTLNESEILEYKNKTKSFRDYKEKYYTLGDAGISSVEYSYLDTIVKERTNVDVNMFVLTEGIILLKYHTMEYALRLANLALAKDGICVDKYDISVIFECESSLKYKKEKLKEMHVKLKEKKAMYDYNEMERMGYNGNILDAFKDIIEEESNKIINLMNDLARKIYFLNWYI